MDVSGIAVMVKVLAVRTAAVWSSDGLDEGCQKAHIVCVRLEFKPDKEAGNLAKHGIDFSSVQKVFADPQRMIVANETHSSDEPRFYAVGHDGHGVLTVRFTLRGDAIRVIGAGY